MKTFLRRYQVLATLVGLLLIVLVLVGVPLKYLAADGGSLQTTGAWITTNLGVLHGWLYMLFLVTAFMLSRAAQWSLKFTIITLLCGTIPIVSFWAERRATSAVKAGFPR